MDPTLDLSRAEMLSLVWEWGATPDGLIPVPYAARLAQLCAWFNEEIVDWRALADAQPRGTLVCPHSLYKPSEAGRKQPGGLYMWDKWSDRQREIHTAFCGGCARCIRGLLGREQGGGSK